MFAYKAGTHCISGKINLAWQSHRGSDILQLRLNCVTVVSMQYCPTIAASRGYERLPALEVPTTLKKER